MQIYNQKITNQLKRADGQLKGILRMMESEKECLDVITQLSAVRSSLDRLIGTIVAENLTICLLMEENSEERDAKLKQAINMIIKK
ncbi:MAG TPA: metal-sensitive transcriptional regulator [Lactovum miscens]|uniref:metal-sensitive transcriptional regulator n=1 Tax=Lactovum miscens TaxID=190387 RepID=UPI002EDB0451